MDDRFKKFIAVVEHGGFNKAARATYISQPALSMSIKQLEQELGVSLFNRHGRDISLTSAGQFVYDAAVTMQLQSRQLIRQLAVLKDHKPLLRVGMIDSVAELLFVQHNILGEISNKADISLTVDGSRRLSEAVATGSLDMAYIVQPQKTLPKVIESYKIGSETLVAVCTPDFYFSTSSGPLPFIAYNEHASSHTIIDAALQSQDISTRVVMRSTSPEIMLKLCLSGLGFTVLPEHTVRAHLSKGLLITLPSPKTITIERPLLAITHQSSAPSTTINTVSKAVRPYFF